MKPLRYSYRDIRWGCYAAPQGEDMKANQMFPSKFLSAADLQGKAHKLVIANLSQQEVGQEKDKKWVLGFKGKEKGLVLNVTNTNMIVEHHGDETDNWVGKMIVLYPTKTSFGGEMKDCIRVKEPEPTEVVDSDEDIPF